MRLLARAGLVDDAIDFQPQRPRQRLRLLFCLLLAPDEKDRGSANHLAGVITLGGGRYKPLASVLDLQTDRHSYLLQICSVRERPDPRVRSGASNSERKPTMKGCADED